MTEDQSGAGAWLDADALVQEGQDFGGPLPRVIAARSARFPKRLPVVRTCAQVIGVEPVELSARKAQALGGGLGLELLSAEGGQHPMNQGKGATVRQLRLLAC